MVNPAVTAQTHTHAHTQLYSLIVEDRAEPPLASPGVYMVILKCFTNKVVLDKKKHKFFFKWEFPVF